MTQQQVKISDFIEKNSIGENDIIPILDSTATSRSLLNKKIKASTLKNYIASFLYNNNYFVTPKQIKGKFLSVTGG